MDELLKEFLGLDVVIEDWKDEDALPLFLRRGREYQVARIAGVQILIVNMPQSDVFGVKELKVQKERLAKKSGMPVVFAFEKMERVKRDALIRAKISFLALPDQAYIPEIGILIQNKRNQAKPTSAVDKLSVNAQKLFLYMLYRKQQEPISKTQAAGNIGMSFASMTRASNELEAVKLLNAKKDGKEILISATAGGWEYFNQARPYLVSPVYKTISVLMSTVPEEAIPAGETTVAQLSDLSNPKTPTWAVYKKEDFPEPEEIDDKWQNDTPYVKLEMWNYDPKLFEEDGHADVVSVYCSLGEIYDERLEYAADTMLKGALK